MPSNVSVIGSMLDRSRISHSRGNRSLTRCSRAQLSARSCADKSPLLGNGMTLSHTTELRHSRAKTMPEGEASRPRLYWPMISAHVLRINIQLAEVLVNRSHVGS
jgi:hypothetical protein